VLYAEPVTSFASPCARTLADHITSGTRSGTSDTCPRRVSDLYWVERPRRLTACPRSPEDDGERAIRRQLVRHRLVAEQCMPDGVDQRRGRLLPLGAALRRRDRQHRARRGGVVHEERTWHPCHREHMPVRWPCHVSHSVLQPNGTLKGVHFVRTPDYVQVCAPVYCRLSNLC
jgi:hypothetical protein